MSNDLNTFIQLIVVAGWIVIFLYSFFRKWRYLSLPQKILLPLVCGLFSLRYTTLFNAVEFKSDWYSILFYLSEILAQLLFIFSFHHKEVKMDDLRQSNISLDIFKKTNDFAPRAICMMEYESNILLYSNPAYKILYGGKVNEDVKDYFDPELLKIYFANNEIVKKSNGKVVDVLEPNAEYVMKKFKKFFAVMNGKDVIVTMSND